MSPDAHLRLREPEARLTADRLPEAIAHLASRDGDLARLADSVGVPPLWARRPGFPTLLLIILEQQVSLASARAVFHKLEASVGRLTPTAFLQLGDGQLRRMGFSRQKAGYCRSLASAIGERSLRLGEIARQGDLEAKESLMRLKGIGHWTADIYLLMALRRPDIWPRGDLALAKAVERAKGLERRPSDDELEEIASLWRPWRAVAARLLWHDYLTNPLTARRSN